MDDLLTRRNNLIKKYPSWNKMTLYQRFAETAAENDSRIFCCDTEKQYTYGKILESVEKTAAALEILGVSEGDRVAVVSGNRVEFLYLTFALSRLGAVKIPINCNIGEDEFLFILKQADVKTVITERRNDVACWKSHGKKYQMIFLGESEEEKNGILSWERFMELGKKKTSEIFCRNAEGISDIIYTSGTTGQPKGVMLTHDMLLRSAFANCINRGFEEGRMIYIPLPLYHVYGYVEGLLAVLFVAGSILFTKGKFSEKKALEAMEIHKANDILSVPTIMVKLLQYPELDQYDLSNLRGIYCSASVCPKWVWKAIRERLHVEEVITGYGMTEVSGASIQTDPLDKDDILAVRVGKVLYGGSAGADDLNGNVIEYKVIDGESGDEMPAGEFGELVCRGPIVTRGYYHNPGATSKVMMKEGWMKTGDIGRIDENGYLHYLGRCNDLYKINGENVSPLFLDKIISKCQNVKCVETVGVPDEKLGWIGVAFIDAVNDDREGREQIKTYCREKLAPYQLPKYYFFLSSKEWPRTVTGKVQKYKLRELAQRLLTADVQKECG